MARVNERVLNSKGDIKIRLRTATSADAASVLNLARLVFQTSEFVLTEPDEFKVTLEEEEKRIDTMEQAPLKLLLVAAIDDQLVGMLDFLNGHRKRISHTGIIGMSVKSEYRGKGIGGMLTSISCRCKASFSKSQTCSF